MIRQDYILRMIEQCFQTLRRLRGLYQAKQFDLARETLDQEFEKFIGAGIEAVLPLSDTELLARIMAEGSFLEVQTKCALLVALLREAGAGYTLQDNPDQSYRCHLKALHLLLEILHREESTVLPQFVPQVDELVSELKEYELPVATNAALMRHYELIGAFDQAENTLATLLETQPQPPGVLELGLAFYQRLLAQSDAALLSGNLPRPEVEAGLKALQLPEREN